MTDDTPKQDGAQDELPNEGEVLSAEPAQDSAPSATELNIDYKDKWLRAQADYQNLQKEISQQRGQWIRMSEQQILEEFIPIYNNFKKAFAHDTGGDNGFESWKKGIEYIMKQFGDVLKAHSIEEIKTLGEQLDTTLHEAVGEEVAEGMQSGVIIKEIDGGYRMGDRVIRPAKVIVAK